jgi:hypothetical protein
MPTPRNSKGQYLKGFGAPNPGGRTKEWWESQRGLEEFQQKEGDKLMMAIARNPKHPAQAAMLIHIEKRVRGQYRQSVTVEPESSITLILHQPDETTGLEIHGD